MTDTGTGDGSVNNDFGKPYVTGTGRYGNNSYDAKRTDYRVTAFGEIRGSDIFNKDSLMAKIIGPQRVTALFSSDDKASETKSWMLYAVDPIYGALTANTGQILDKTNFAPNVVSFLGNSLKSASTVKGEAA